MALFQETQKVNDKLIAHVNVLKQCTSNQV